jgi:hypothetical protein
LDALLGHELRTHDAADWRDGGGIESVSDKLAAALALVAEVTAERDDMAARLGALQAECRTSSASDSFARYLPKLSSVPGRSSGAETRRSGVSSDCGEDGRLSARGSFEYSLDAPPPAPASVDRAAQAQLLAALRSRLGDARGSLAALRAQAAAACDEQAAALREAGGQLVAVAAAAGAAHAGFAREASERKRLHNQVPAHPPRTPPPPLPRAVFPALCPSRPSAPTRGMGRLLRPPGAVVARGDNRRGWRRQTFTPPP